MNRAKCRRLSIGLSAGLLAMALGIAAHSEHRTGLTQSEVLAEIQKAQSSTQSFECRFVERIVRPGLPETIVRGRLRGRRPNQLRIDQRAPDQQVIVADGRTVRVYTPAAGQMVTGDWRHWRAQNSFPEPLLSFAGDLPVERWDDRYQIFFGGYNQGLYQLIFHPRNREDRPLELWISDETFLPQRGRSRTAENTIDVVLEDWRVNGPLRENAFSLEIPKGTVIVPMPS